MVRVEPASLDLERRTRPFDPRVLDARFASHRSRNPDGADCASGPPCSLGTHARRKARGGGGRRQKGERNGAILLCFFRAYKRRPYDERRSVSRDSWPEHCCRDRIQRDWHCA